MIRGIAILGLNGCGKSTLAHALAKKLNFYEMDVEDYYFPEQEESRKKVLDNNEHYFVGFCDENRQEHLADITNDLKSIQFGLIFEFE